MTFFREYFPNFKTPLIYSLLINFFLLLVVSNLTYVRHITVRKIFSVDFIKLQKKAAPKKKKKVIKKKEKILPQLPQDTENISLKAEKQVLPVEPQIYDISELDSIPQILYMVKPEYPEELRLLNKEEKVMVKFLVNEEGNVEKVEISEPVEEPLFVRASIEAVKKWRFSPPLVNGKHVKVWFTLPVKFELE